MARSVMWFRRDLRCADHPALSEAADAGEVVALFVLDDTLRRPSGPNRLAFLYRSLRALDASIGGRLVVRTGDPTEIVPAVAAEAGAPTVHVTADFGPYGRARDAAVGAALAGDGRALVATGSPYAVAPGSVLRGGQAFRVFSPYYRAWKAHGWEPPLGAPAVRWGTLPSDGVPPDPDDVAAILPAGEAAARERAERFLARAGRYDEVRNDPGADSTSRLSVYLKYGCIHPRQLLAALQGGKAHERFRMELAWRDFYGDVLWHVPQSAREPLDPTVGAIRVDTGAEADRRFEAWAAGRTGFPIVDAGMRQLVQEGWMHNRVRMITASFLVKDLHLDWRRGARHFLRHLQDGDLASNNHGWQWVAGTGTDPAPYFRVFNPTLQGRKFDPTGTYVRRYVPELARVDDDAVHEPWRAAGGPPPGYPPPIVDHAAERREALARYAEVRGG